MTPRPGVPALAAAARASGATAWRAAPWSLAGYVLLMAAEGLAPVAVAWLTKLVIDGLVGSAPAAELVAVALALAGVGLLAAVLPHGSRFLAGQVERSFLAATSDQLFTVVGALPGLRRFEDPRFLDRLRLAQEGAASGGVMVIGVFQVGRSMITLVGFVGTLLVVSPVMTGVVLASAVPALLAHLRLSRRRAEMVWQVSPTERRQLFYQTLLSTVEAAKEIRLFGSAGFLRGRMMTHLRAANTARRRMDQRELTTEGVLAVLGAATAGGGLVWAITAAHAGALTVGDIALFIAAVAGVLGGLQTLVQSIADVHHGLLLFDHHLAVVRGEPDLALAVAPRRLPPLRRGIALRDVWFRYSDEHPWVLRGVTLEIPADTAVAIVGLNGAGKSTLVKLLCRLYDPCHGTIHWDDVDLREVRPEELRARISGVFQDHMAYDLSARENVAIGDIASGDEPVRVRRAAGLAGVDRVLRALPRGYETPLTRMFFGEEDKSDPTTGVVLSGGQWQRVALARAFFRDGRDLMIMDEPSAGLDPRAEAEVHARMRRYRAGRTSLLISHRLNTVRDADTLVVIEDGLVVEQGSHDSLMREDGRYARMFRTQASGYQLDHARKEVPPPDIEKLTIGTSERGDR